MAFDRVYSAMIDGNFVDMLTYDDVMHLNKNLVSMIRKEYYPIYQEGRISNIKKDICLFTIDCKLTYEEYITNYNNLPNMYGVNAINDNDIVICKEYNNKYSNLNYLNDTDKQNKRKRTKSIDYEYEE
jgi:hypothetical protein